eukprot:m.35300 g.35300  ORF g.35300 m.35300 type:complete len:194 (+) comp12380_c0_seq1:52-633(+)
MEHAVCCFGTSIRVKYLLLSKLLREHSVTWLSCCKLCFARFPTSFLLLLIGLYCIHNYPSLRCWNSNSVIMDTGLSDANVAMNNTHSFLKEPSPELSQVCRDSLNWFYDNQFDSAGMEIVEQTMAQTKANASSHRSLRFRSLTSRHRRKQPKVDEVFAAGPPAELSTADDTPSNVKAYSQSMRPVKQRYNSTS